MPYPHRRMDFVARVEEQVARGRELSLELSLPKTWPVRTVAIVGAGMMGTTIAAANVGRRLPVVLTDANPQALATATQRIAAAAGGPVDGLIATTTDLRRIGACDLVIESIVESAAAKRQILSELEPHLAEGATLVSNTSTIPIADLAAGLRDPGRFCGLHFFHPVRRRPLVEIVRGPQTSAATLAKAAGYARTIGKTPLVVHDGPGFLVNRLLMPYLSEALELLRDGLAIEHIQRAATEFGMAMGPLQIADEIGLDTLLLAGRVLWEAFPERIVPSPILIAMYKERRLGRRAGRGFFAYRPGLPEDQPGEPDPQAAEIIAGWSRGTRAFSSEEITARLFLPMILEATRILDEGRSVDPQTIDTAVTLGLGFPAREGGLLRWADALGAEQIVAMLRELSPLGPRVAPTPLLEQMARRDGTFYAAEPAPGRHRFAPRSARLLAPALA